MEKDKMPVQGRRGTLYHVAYLASFAKTPSMAQIKIRTKFAAGHFLLTTPGLLKVVIILVLGTAGAIFLSSTCPETPDWFSWLFPVASFTSAAVTLVMFALFLLGSAEDNPKWWVRTDIILCLVTALFTLGTSIASMVECPSPKIVYQVPGPLGLAGAILLLLSAASIYLYYRLGHEKASAPEVDESDLPPQVPVRKNSVIV